MTKYVVSGYIGFDNFGDEAIANVLISHLKKNGAEKITVISSNPERTSANYGVESVGMLKFLSAVKDADVLISGGGSLLQDVTSLKSLIYYLGIIYYALALGKKVIIFAQGFTPFRTKIGEFFTKFVLKRCSKISVRDKKSQQMLQEMGIKSELVADPIFGVEMPVQEKENAIGIQLRSYPTINDDFLEKLADKIKEKFSDKEIRLFSFQDSLDLEILKKIALKLKQRGLESKIYQKLSVEEVLCETSKLETLIAMRFHALLVGAKSKTKLLGINYDIKVESLSKAVGFSCVEINQEDLNEDFEKLLNIDVQKYNIPEFKFPNI